MQHVHKEQPCVVDNSANKAISSLQTHMHTKNTESTSYQPTTTTFLKSVNKNQSRHTSAKQKNAASLMYTSFFLNDQSFYNFSKLTLKIPTPYDLFRDDFVRKSSTLFHAYIHVFVICIYQS